MAQNRAELQAIVQRDSEAQSATESGTSDERLDRSIRTKAAKVSAEAIQESVAEAGLPESGRNVQVTFPDQSVENLRVGAYEQTPAGRIRVNLVDENGDVAFSGDPADIQMKPIAGDGTKGAPAVVEDAADVERAAAQAQQPTPAQAESDNYKQGHMKWQGFDLAIETPAGGTRTHPQGHWSVEDYPAHYGKIKGTRGADGDHLDFFMGPNPESTQVIILDQIDPATGKFDEHKVFLGFPEEGRPLSIQDPPAWLEAYNDAFTDGSALSRIGDIEAVTLDQFQAWSKSGDTTKPFRYKEQPVPEGPRAPRVGEPAPSGDPAPPAETPKPIDPAQTTEGEPGAALEGPQAPAAAPPPVRQGRTRGARGEPKNVSRQARDLMPFLARAGGIKDVGGELRAMDAHLWKLPFIPKLVQDTGMDPDMAREAAVEAGFLPEGASIDDLYEAIRVALGGVAVGRPEDVGAELDAGDERRAASARSEMENAAADLDIDITGLDDNAAALRIAAELEARATPETAADTAQLLEDEVDRLTREALAAEGVTDEEVSVQEGPGPEDIPFPEPGAGPRPAEAAAAAPAAEAGQEPRGDREAAGRDRDTAAGQPAAAEGDRREELKPQQKRRNAAFEYAAQQRAKAAAEKTTEALQDDLRLVEKEISEGGNRQRVAMAQLRKETIEAELSKRRAPAQPGREASAQPVSPKRKRKPRQKKPPGVDVAREHFKAGAIVPSYGGQMDRVIQYIDMGNGRWTVRVQAVEEGPQGLQLAKDARIRQHETFPDPQAQRSARALRERYGDKPDLLDTPTQAEFNSALPQREGLVDENAMAQVLEKVAGRPAAWKDLTSYQKEQALAEARSLPQTEETEQGTQQIIPGAERISDRQLAERKMEGRKKAAKPQKDADEGLFDVAARDQGEMFKPAPKGIKSEFWAKKDDLRREMIEIARRVNPEVSVRFVKELWGEGEALRAHGESGERQEIAGKYTRLQRMVTISLNFPKWETRDSVYHELWHSLEEVLTPAERDILLKRFPARDGITHEEVAAMAFGEWATNRDSIPRGPVRRIFQKIANFLKAIGKMLRGQGFRTAESIFEDAYKGELGNRMKPREKTTLQDLPEMQDEVINAMVRLGWPEEEARKLAMEDLAEVLREGEQYALGRRNRTNRSGTVKGTQDQEQVIDRFIHHDPDVPWWRQWRDAIVAFVKRLDEEWKQGIFDQFAAIAELEKAVTGKIQDAAASAWKMALRTQNLEGVMIAVLKGGPLRYNRAAGMFEIDRSQGGGFESIFEPLAKTGKLRLWKGWAAAVRANRLNREGREALMASVAQDLGMSTQQAIDHLLALGGDPMDPNYSGPVQHPEFRAAWDRWQLFNKTMLDMAEDVGVINAAQRAVWEKADYIPFYRVIDEAAGGAKGPARQMGLSGQRAPIRELKGGESKIGDPIENMVLNMSRLVDASFKTVAMQRVKELAEPAGVMTRVPKVQVKQALVPAAAAKKALEQIGVNVDALTPAQRRQFLSTFQLTAPKDPDVVSLMESGEAVFYRVEDPMLLRALTSINAERMGKVLELMGGAKRLLTHAVTADPAFMLANIIRDTVQAKVVTGEKFGLGLATVKGAIDAARLDPDLLDIFAAGGGTGGFYKTAGRDVRRHLEARLDHAQWTRRRWSTSTSQPGRSGSRSALRPRTRTAWPSTAR